MLCSYSWMQSKFYIIPMKFEYTFKELSSDTCCHLAGSQLSLQYNNSLACVILTINRNILDGRLSKLAKNLSENLDILRHSLVITISDVDSHTPVLSGRVYIATNLKDLIICIFGWCITSPTDTSSSEMQYNSQQSGYHGEHAYRTLVNHVCHICSVVFHRIIPCVVTNRNGPWCAWLIV